MKNYSKWHQIYSRRDFVIVTAKMSFFAGSIFVFIDLIRKRKIADRVREIPSLNLSQFIVLSRFITGKVDLDPKTAQRILEAFNATSVVRQGLIELYKKYEIMEHSPFKHQAEDSLVSFAQLNSDNEELYRNVLSTWYTGIYSDREGSMRISYFDALMYRPTVGIRNIPSSCGGALGYWTLPPTMESA